MLPDYSRADLRAARRSGAGADTRVFVSTAGSDSNPCTVSSPCRTFAQAYTAVATNGEIDVLTPGGYGGLTISKAISIQGHGYAGISVASGGTGITINAPSTDSVNLNGLLIDGGGVGQNGIVFNSGKSLTIENTVVRKTIYYGLGFLPTAASTLAVSDSYFTDVPNFAFFIFPQGGSSTVTASIDRTGVFGSGNGLYANGGASTGVVNVAVTDSVAANNATGFVVASFYNTAVVNFAMTHCQAVGNATGIEAAGGATATLWLAQSTVTRKLAWVRSGHERSHK